MGHFGEEAPAPKQKNTVYCRGKKCVVLLVEKSERGSGERITLQKLNKNGEPIHKPFVVYGQITKKTPHV